MRGGSELSLTDDFAVLNSHFWCWDSYFLKEAKFFCMVGLPLFGKEGSGTPVFKILVRALGIIPPVIRGFGGLPREFF